MSRTVRCQVLQCVGECVCLCCSCGGVSSVHSPLVVVVGGAIAEGRVALWWWVACCPCHLHSVPCLRIRSGTRIVRSSLALHSLVSCCPLSLCVAVLLCCVGKTGGWCVFQCDVCVVLLCCLVEWRWGAEGVCGLFVCLPLLSVFPSLLPLSLLLLVFGVVRAQPCEHARYPRTPLRLPLLFAFSSLLFSSAPRLSSPSAFSSAVGMAVGDSPCVGVLCWHDGDG